jgi:hypothetical protein
MKKEKKNLKDCSESIQRFGIYG